MQSKPTFAQWREQMELSLEEAAELLGLGRSQVCVLCRGVDGLGRPAVPGLDTRMLMSAASAGIPLRPWRLSEEEVAAAQRAIRRRRIAAQRRTRISEAA